MWLLIGRLLVRVQPGERIRPSDLHLCLGQGAFFVSKHVLAKSDGLRSMPWLRIRPGHWNPGSPTVLLSVSVSRRGRHWRHSLPGQWRSVAGERRLAGRWLE